LIVVLFKFFLSSSEATTSERWTKLDEVVFPEQLKKSMPRRSKKRAGAVPAVPQHGAVSMEGAIAQPLMSSRSALLETNM